MKDTNLIFCEGNKCPNCNTRMANDLLEYHKSGKCNQDLKKVPKDCFIGEYLKKAEQLKNKIKWWGRNYTFPNHSQDEGVSKNNSSPDILPKQDKTISGENKCLTCGHSRINHVKFGGCIINNCSCMKFIPQNKGVINGN